MGLVTQGMIIVTGVTGIYLNRVRALNFTPRNLLLDISMVSVIIALQGVGAMLIRLHSIVLNQTKWDSIKHTDEVKAYENRYHAGFLLGEE